MQFDLVDFRNDSGFVYGFRLFKDAERRLFEMGSRCYFGIFLNVLGQSNNILFYFNLNI